jgi:hypothetical protein
VKERGNKRGREKEVQRQREREREWERELERERGESEKERRGGTEPAGQCKQFEYAGWGSESKQGIEGLRVETERKEGRKRGKKREIELECM